MTYIKDRILQIADIKETNRDVFFDKFSFSYSNFRGKSKISSPNADILVEISSVYPDVNINWLLTGEGEMFKKEQFDTNPVKTIPLIPIEAMAGFGTGDVQVMDYQTSGYKIPEFEDIRADFMIRIKGSSMYPKYNSGDLVACRKVALGSFFQWNKVYVLDTSQGALVKRIRKSENEESLLMVSDNEKYSPFEVPLSEIYAIALVVGVIRLE
ncbi:phage repressor protein C with HTH and peptisase S24 domain [Mesonia hippocampi]|uniref:Phage repressor protein C with HTH and peptisase S24 domain n=1 Tax=Mesonia hippocampi TaxID=1628250 RepID=A0A840ELC8_9FLAO|nr:helix-turn-helix transcriptional regulator [Mesonia hippocampi]MBB4117901.1 phage repressor protein C with HTH and peptisase S24 domain [Mesonia hippocampi]